MSIVFIKQGKTEPEGTACGPNRLKTWRAGTTVPLTVAPTCAPEDELGHQSDTAGRGARQLLRRGTM